MRVRSLQRASLQLHAPQCCMTSILSKTPIIIEEDYARERLFLTFAGILAIIPTAAVIIRSLFGTLHADSRALLDYRFGIHDFYPIKNCALRHVELLSPRKVQLSNLFVTSVQLSAPTIGKLFFELVACFVFETRLPIDRSVEHIKSVIAN